MSSESEIREVYEGDIGKQTDEVLRKYGVKPFYEDFDGMEVESVWPVEWLETLARIDMAPAASAAQEGVQR